MTKPNHEHNLTAWLGDTDEKVDPDLLLQALDALYGNPPGGDAIIQAQSNLRKALMALQQDDIYYDAFTHSLIGTIYAATSEKGLLAVDFGVREQDFLDQITKLTEKTPVRSPEKIAEIRRQIREFLNGERKRFDLVVDLAALTTFQRQVLSSTQKVPHGQVVTYAEIAKRIGKPKAVRAVGQALGRNPVPIVIPCHRVVASNGSLRGYSGGGGVKTKAKLLALEKSQLF